MQFVYYLFATFSVGLQLVCWLKNQFLLFGCILSALCSCSKYVYVRQNTLEIETDNVLVLSNGKCERKEMVGN